MSIPVVDLADFLSGDSDKKTSFVKALGEAYETVGFVAVKNHGIPDALIAAQYDQVQQFFSLPLEKKLKYEIEGLAGQRGYTSFGREHAKGSEAPDLKEFFQYGQTVPSDHPLKWEYPDNVAVSEIASLNNTLLEAYRNFEKSGKALLQAIAIYLELDEHFFDAHIEEGNSILRCIHYPTITQEPKSAIRAEQHEDINLIIDDLSNLNFSGQYTIQSVESFGEKTLGNIPKPSKYIDKNKLNTSSNFTIKLINTNL